MNALCEVLLSNAAVATVMAVVVLGISCFVRHPQVRHFLWLLVLVRLAMPPILRINVAPGVVERSPTIVADVVATKPVVRPTVPSKSHEFKISPFVASGQAGKPDLRAWANTPTAAVVDSRTSSWIRMFESIDLRGALLTLWAAGGTIYVALLLRRSRAFAVALRGMSRPGSPELLTEIDNVARRIGLRRLPRIAMIERDAGPMVWRYGFRATLVLPSLLMEQLTLRERELLIAHELVHLRRGDDWLMWFAAGVKAAFWWLPTSWLAVSRLQRAAEECCDAVVVSVYGESDAYAETLYRAAEFATTGKLPSPLMSGGAGDKSQLKARLDMILTKPLRRLPRLVWIALFAISLLFNALFLSYELETSASRDMREKLSLNRVNGRPVRYVPVPTPVQTAPLAQVYLLSDVSRASATKKVTRTSAPARREPAPVPFEENDDVMPLRVVVDSKSNLSDEVRKKVIAKLGQKVSDPDRAIVQQSIEGLAKSGDRPAIEAALLAMLAAPSTERFNEFDHLQLAWEMFRRDIAEEQVRAFLLKTAQETTLLENQQLALCLIIAAGQPPKAAEHVKALIALIGSSKISAEISKPVDAGAIAVSKMNELGPLCALLEAHTREKPGNGINEVVNAINSLAKQGDAKFDTPKALAAFALSRIEANTDDIALILLEATDSKEPEVQKAAMKALSRAVHADPARPTGGPEFDFLRPRRKPHETTFKATPFETTPGSPK